MSEKNEIQKVKSTNELFPIFLKLQNFHTLLVGAGNVGLEKLSALLQNSPQANVSVVATEINPDFEHFAAGYSNVVVERRAFRDDDIEGVSLIILATDNFKLHSYVFELAKERGILINVADTPDLCDLYLGSIVRKGNLKIAISTNGKSPTLAKRLKEVLNDALPEEIDKSLDNLQSIRDSLKGDFSYKVKKMNEITSGLVEDRKTIVVSLRSYWLMISTVIILIMVLFFVLFFKF